MKDSSDPAFDPNTMFQQWMRSMTETWSGMLAPLQPDTAEGDESAGDEAASKSGDASRDPSLDAALRFMKTSASTFGDPGKWNEMFAGLNAMPHVFMKMMQPAIENMAGMHGKWLEKMGSLGKLPDDFDMGHLEKESLSIFNRFYDTEFKKLLNIPQLGPGREAQEKINCYMDRFAVLQSALAEFLNHLYAPLRNAYTTFQNRLADLTEAGEDLPKDFKAYYQLWLKTLEGHYMTALQNPEFLGALSKTLNAFANYTKARKDLVNDLMHRLSLPAPGDIDALYKDLYDVKKRLKAIERQMGKNSRK